MGELANSTDKGLMHKSISRQLKLQSLLTKDKFRLQIIECVTTRKHGVGSNEGMIIKWQTCGGKLNQLKVEHRTLNCSTGINQTFNMM